MQEEPAQQQQSAGRLPHQAVLDSLKEAYRTDDSGMMFWEVARSHRQGHCPRCGALGMQYRVCNSAGTTVAWHACAGLTACLRRTLRNT